LPLPPPSSFASINTGEPRFTWKMAVKTAREKRFINKIPVDNVFSLQCFDTVG